MKTYSELFREARRLIQSTKNPHITSDLLTEVTNQADIDTREWFNVAYQPIHLWEVYHIGDANENEFLNDFSGNKELSVEEALSYLDDHLAIQFHIQWEKAVSNANVYFEVQKKAEAQI